MDITDAPWDIMPGKTCQQETCTGRLADILLARVAPGFRCQPLLLVRVWGWVAHIASRIALSIFNRSTWGPHCKGPCMYPSRGGNSRGGNTPSGYDKHTHMACF